MLVVCVWWIWKDCNHSIRKHQGRVGDKIGVRVCLQGGWDCVSGGCPYGKHGIPVDECGER